MLTQNILQSSNKEQRGSSQAPSVRQVINLRLTEEPHVRQNFYGDFFMHTANTYLQLRKYTKDDDMIYQPDQVTLSVDEDSTKATLCKEDTDQAACRQPRRYQMGCSLAFTADPGSLFTCKAPLIQQSVPALIEDHKPTNKQGESLYPASLDSWLWVTY